MVTTTNIEALISETVTRVNPEAWIVELVLPEGRNHTLSLRVDTDKGISIDECTAISRELSQLLEAADPFDFPWTLEVSSPGVGRPLTVKRQYVKNIGRKLKVTTTARGVQTGILTAVDEEGIVLSPEAKAPKPGMQKKKDAGPEIRILFTEIKEAKVQISIG